MITCKGKVREKNKVQKMMYKKKWITRKNKIRGKWCIRKINYKNNSMWEK